MRHITSLSCSCIISEYFQFFCHRSPRLNAPFELAVIAISSIINKTTEVLSHRKIKLPGRCWKKEKKKPKVLGKMSLVM